MLAWWKTRLPRPGRAQTLVALRAEIPPVNALFIAIGERRAREFLSRAIQRLGHRVASHHGIIARLEQTTLLALFEHASDALDAAQALQCDLRDWVRPIADGVDLQLHIGLSKGEVHSLPVSEGPTIARVTELAAASAGGQILLDDSVADALSDEASDGLVRVLCDDTGSGASLAWQYPWRCDSLASPALTAWLRLETPDGSQRLVAPTAPVTLGRAPGCDVHVSRAESSRRHAQILWRGASFTLADTSRNGTWLRFGRSGVVVRIRQTTTPLPVSGALYLGRKPAEHGTPDVVFTLQPTASPPEVASTAQG